MPDEKIDEKRPAHADNELRKMQQRLVDDTVDDSFPASDPPAWTTTGAKSVAARHDTDESAEPPQESDAERQGGDTVRRAIDQASSLAEGVYRHSGEYLQQARSRFPEADRYARQSAKAFARPVQQYPIPALLAAAAVGYGVAWLIHSRTRTPGFHPGRRRPAMSHGRSEPYGKPAATGPQGSGDSPKPHGDKYADVIRKVADGRSN